MTGNWLASVGLDEDWPGVIKVQDINGAVMHYRITADGTLELGRPMSALSPDKRYVVTLFVSMPYGIPVTVLEVRENA